MADEIGFEVHLDVPYPQAIEEVVAALKQQGFGVLTQIDVRATMQEKLVLISGLTPFWRLQPAPGSPGSSEEPLAGLMLPCNVTVESDESGGVTSGLPTPK
jgi:uncharacterized protein (DUF302 family)